MLDWLRRPANAPLLVRVGSTQLPLVIRRLPQARRMTLRLAPDGSEVRVSMPRWGRSADALAFAEARGEWLEQQFCRLPARQEIVSGSLVSYRGEVLQIAHAPSRPRRPVVSEGALLLGGPAEGLDQRLRRWLQAEARLLFAQDLAHYADRAGQPVPRLALSAARSRWGSCSHAGIVRLNWRLVMAPDWVRRSVVAHEVTHLSHFNHSRAFHMALAALYEGDIAAANRWLKQEGRGLYAPFG